VSPPRAPSIQLTALFAVLFAVSLLVLGGCSGGDGPQEKRPPIRTSEALEKRLAQLDVSILEDAEFVEVTPTARGFRFRYEMPFEGQDTYERVQSYYRDEFGSVLVRKGWKEPPMSTHLRMIFTKGGETITVENTIPSASSVSGNQVTYIGHSIR